MRVSGVKVGSITDMVIAPGSYLAIVQFRIRDDLFLPPTEGIGFHYGPRNIGILRC